MKKLILFFLAPALSWGACRNEIAKSKVEKALDQTLLPHESFQCIEGEMCLCFDHVRDWREMKMEGDAIVVDPAKRAALESEKASQRDAEAARANKKAQAKAALKAADLEKIGDKDTKEFLKVIKELLE